MVPSARSIPASPSMPAGSILILPMSIGAPLRLAPTAGECSDVRQCGSVEPLLCCRCRYRNAADRSSPAVLPQSFEPDFVLVVAWLLAALRSSGPYPLLAISGE